MLGAIYALGFSLGRIAYSLAFLVFSLVLRHFVDDSLPRIRWANPNLDIIVRKANKTPQEQWKAEMEVEFGA